MGATILKKKKVKNVVIFTEMHFFFLLVAQVPRDSAIIALDWIS